MPQAAVTKSRNDKKKIVKMFALVIIIFVVCWAPYHIYFIYSYHNPQITKATNLLKLTRPECLIVAKDWLFELKSVTYRLSDHGLLFLELLSQLNRSLKMYF